MVPPPLYLVTDGAFPQDPTWLVVCEIRLPIAPHKQFRGAFYVQAASKRAAETVALAHSDPILVTHMQVLPWEGTVPRRVSWMRPQQPPA